jgi:hypothetical protein
VGSQVAVGWRGGFPHQARVSWVLRLRRSIGAVSRQLSESGRELDAGPNAELGPGARDRISGPAPVQHDPFKRGTYDAAFWLTLERKNPEKAHTGGR